MEEVLTLEVPVPIMDQIRMGRQADTVAARALTVLALHLGIRILPVNIQMDMDPTDQMIRPMEATRVEVMDKVQVRVMPDRPSPVRRLEIPDLMDSIPVRVHMILQQILNIAITEAKAVAIQAASVGVLHPMTTVSILHIPVSHMVAVTIAVTVNQVVRDMVNLLVLVSDIVSTDRTPYLLRLVQALPVLALVLTAGDMEVKMDHKV